MLVLTRREDDTVRFPDLGITIEVLQLKGSNVKLGIDAPIEIKVLRGELESSRPDCSRSILIKEATEHAVRNKLNSLRIAIAVAEKHIEANRHELAANILDKTISRLGVETNGTDAADIRSVSQVDPSVVRALLVEDSENERTMLAGLLRLHGYHVDTVADGAEAIDFLEGNLKPDFIVMDMCMPNLDGAAAVRKIRQVPAFDGIEIIAVSGKTPKTAGIDVDKNRIANWFQKPLEPKLLLQAISYKAPEPSAN